MVVAALAQARLPCRAPNSVAPASPHWAGRYRHSEARTWQSDGVLRSSSSVADGRGCLQHLFASVGRALSELKGCRGTYGIRGRLLHAAQVSAPGGGGERRPVSPEAPVSHAVATMRVLFYNGQKIFAK